MDGQCCLNHVSLLSLVHPILARPMDFNKSVGVGAICWNNPVITFYVLIGSNMCKPCFDMFANVDVFVGLNTECLISDVLCIVVSIVFIHNQINIIYIYN